MQVILAEEQTLELQHMIGELIKSEVKNARESVGADSPFLNIPSEYELQGDMPL